MKNKLILLVEDKRDDAMLALRALKECHINSQVEVVRDGEEALDFLWQRGRYAENPPIQIPHVILLDIKLPKMDGLEVLQNIRASDRTRHYPVVMLTSSKEPRDIEESYRLGANSYIQKPLDFSRFIDAVRQIGTYWLTLNEIPVA